MCVCVWCVYVCVFGVVWCGVCVWCDVCMCCVSVSVFVCVCVFVCVSWRGSVLTLNCIQERAQISFIPWQGE